MAARNQKSSTLPSNLRHRVEHSEESGSFLSKLKKKLKFKKSKYQVDVNTGECENVSAVSFRKRESREVLEDEMPWKLREYTLDGKESSGRSPRLTKSVFGKIPDRQGNDVGVRSPERKLSNPESYTRSLQSSELHDFQRSSLGTKKKSKFANEYSPLHYETKENLPDRSHKLRDSVKNDCLVDDDTAVDLDSNIERTGVRVSQDVKDTYLDNFGFDPGYEKLPVQRPPEDKSDLKHDKVVDVDKHCELAHDLVDKFNHDCKNGKVMQYESDFDPNYESVDEARAKLKENMSKVNSDHVSDNFQLEYDPGYQSLNEVKRNQVITDKSDQFEFDPGYQSVKDVKRNVVSAKTSDQLEFDPGYQSVKDVKRNQVSANPSDQLEFDPGYQSVKNVNRNRQSSYKSDPCYQSIDDVKEEIVDSESRRPAKTYKKNQSIESLDEPGYESLNDVKKKISEQNFDKNIKTDMTAEQSTGVNDIGVRNEDSNDSSIDSVTAVDLGNMTVTESQISCKTGFQNRFRSKSGDVVMNKSDSISGLQAFTETALSLTNIATVLTGPSNGRYRKKHEKRPDTAVTDVLYSTVKKTEKSHSEDLYSSLNRERKKSSSITPSQQTSQGVTDAATLGDNNTKPEVTDAYDSDTEYTLDPGYAECADAIKGFIPPYTIFSEGSSSKMSSCTSLDLSAEDFILEPGYAECADAIKSGAIKKISVSREHLVDHALLGRHDVKTEIGSEIYANPQILFRKKSKMLEDGNAYDSDHKDAPEKGDLLNDHFCKAEESVNHSVENGSKIRESKIITKQEKKPPPEAPPLPARNYSLYLDNEEAEVIVQEVLEACEVKENTDNLSLDEAFEEESVNEFLDDVETNDARAEIDFDESKSNTKDKICTSPLVNVHVGVNISDENAESYIHDTDMDNSCLHVTVQDHSGKKMVLKILEKEESYRTQQKREQVRKRTCGCEDTVDPDSSVVDQALNEQSCNICEKPKDLFEISDDQENEKPKTPTNHDLIKTKEFTRSANTKTSHDCKQSLSEHVMETKHENNSGHISHIMVTPGLQDGTFSFAETITKAQCPEIKDPQLSNDTKDSLDDQTSCSISTNTFTYPANTSESDPSNFLSVTPVRMKILSIDSDSDMFNTEDLPKLEIHESDLDSAFDSSDNSNNLDIETEKADIDKLTERLNNEHIDIVCTKSNMVNKAENKISEDVICKNDTEVNSAKEADTECCINVVVNSSNIEQDSKEHFDERIKDLTNVNTETSKAFAEKNVTSDVSKVVEVSKSDSTDVKDSDHSDDDVFEECTDVGKLDKTSTLESRLCVIDSETDMESDLAKLLEGVSDETTAYSDDDETDLDHRSAEDVSNQTAAKTSCDCECFDGQIMFGNGSSAKVHSLDCSCLRKPVISDANSSKDVTSEIMSSSKQLHLKYEREHPNLYEDTEPTHMSLNEALGLSQNLAHRQSDKSADILLDKTVAVSNTGILSAAPPRPPPLIGTLSSPRLPSPCRSNQLSEATPLDEVPLQRLPSPGQSSHLITVTPLDEVPLQRLPSPGQSSHLIAVTPLDEVPLHLRFLVLDGMNHSDDEAPPAIPPRARSVRSSRPPVTYPQQQDFMESMKQLKNSGWYWGPLKWDEAEAKLINKPEGSFLVRDSSDEHYILSLSFKNQGRVHHTRIEHHKGHFSFWSQPDSHGKSTIKEFIEQCVENSRNGRFLYFIRPSGPGSPPMPIQLLNPVSRFIQMRSLQHMCRFRILQLVRRDHIDLLPIPKQIKQYLQEAQYYVEYLED